MCKVWLKHCTTSQTIKNLPQNVITPCFLPVIEVPETIDISLTLQQVVRTLPTPYQHIFGNIDYPSDDGAALADAIRRRSLSLYSDGTVDLGCRAHTYTLHTVSDEEDLEITGAAPTCGDLSTISSL